MPSGAKKRKAAKKKKENQNQNQSNNSAPAHPHGDEYLKHQNDRGSEVGEVNSPTSQREIRETYSMEGSRSDNGEEQVRAEESVVRVEKEIKIEDELGVKDGIIDHNEANRKSYDGGSSGSSGGSSSSEDESHGINKGQAVTSIASVGSVEMADSLSGKSVKPVCDPLTAVVGDSIVAPCVVEPTLEEKGEKKFSSVEERICMSGNAASYGKEEENVRSAESTPKTLDPKECVTQENDDRSTSSCIAPRAAVDNGARLVKDSVATQPVVVSSPYPVQKTSWKSCCGLFEVFAGSGV